MKEFAEFLSNLCYEYELCRSVTESVYLAAEKVNGEIKHHLERLGRVLEEENTEQDISEIRFPRYLKQMKLFLIQCRNAIMYGSGKKGQESVFVRNMTELRRDVLNECIKREQSAFLFAGLGFISAVPVLFLPLVSRWGSDNMPELLEFYGGISGKLTAAATILITVICYIFLSLVRNVEGSVYRRPKVFGYFFDSGFAAALGTWFSGKKLEKWAGKQLETAGIYRGGTDYLLACGMSGTVLSLLVIWIVRREGIMLMLCAGTLAFLLGAVGMMGFYRYLSFLRNLGVNGEVLGLQSIILLLFEAPNMTIERILEIMEEYSSVFRRELAACADRYAAEEEEALLLLIREGSFPEFTRLIHRLQISERLGLFRAFVELAADRQYFREQQRMDTEQELKKRAANAQVVAFLPMFFLLFAYLIIPFLTASLSQMSEIFSEMNQMRLF